MKKIIILFSLFFLPLILLGERDKKIITTEHGITTRQEFKLEGIVRRFDNDSIWILRPVVGYEYLNGSMIERKQSFKKSFYILGENMDKVTNDAIYYFFTGSMYYKSVTLRGEKKLGILTSYTKKVEGQFEIRGNILSLKLNPIIRNGFSISSLFFIVFTLSFIYLLINKHKEKKKRSSEEKSSSIILLILLVLTVISLFPPFILEFYIPLVGAVIFIIRSLGIFNDDCKINYYSSDIFWYLLFLFIIFFFSENLWLVMIFQPGFFLNLFWISYVFFIFFFFYSVISTEPKNN